MPKANGRRGIVRALGTWFAFLAAWAGPAETARTQPPLPRPAESPSSVEERLRRLEAVNTELLDRLDRLDRDRDESDRRYHELEGRYNELRRRVGETGPDAEPEGARPEGGSGPSDGPEGAGEAGEGGGRISHLGRPGELGRGLAVPELPLKAQFSDGFQLSSRDDEFELRFHVLDQTDFKLFSPNDRSFGKSGLYIPRLRL